MENTHNDEMEIDLMELFYALKRRIFFILAVGLLCGCLSAAYTNFFMTPIYTSRATITTTIFFQKEDLRMGFSRRRSGGRFS